MDSRAVRHFVRQYGGRETLATLGDASLCVREGGLFCRTGDDDDRPACERCFALYCSRAQAPPRKKRRLAAAEGSPSHRRQRLDEHCTLPASSAVQLWLARLANAEPFVEKKAGTRMLEHYGVSFKLVNNERLVFKEWRVGQASADRPACESCYEHENLATLATVARDRGWPTLCARHAEFQEQQMTAAPSERAETAVDGATKYTPKKRKQHVGQETKHTEQRMETKEGQFLIEKEKKTKKQQLAMKKQFVYEQCNKSFSRRQNLQSHLRTHSGERPFVCVQCNARFAHRSNLTTHFRTHSGEKPYACVQCNARFAQSSALKSHLYVHSGLKPYACTQCVACFTQSNELTKHKRSHSGEKRFAWSECNARFGRLDYLQLHLRIHSEERPFACKVCLARFTQASALRMHVRTHSGEKPYQCGECAQSFSDGANLLKHKRVHSGEKPYKCDECDRSFFRNDHLKVHSQQHEESKKWQHVCAFASFSTAKFQVGVGLLQCITRCKTQRMLENHVQRCHTEEGIAKRFKSKQQLAEFLTAQDWAFDRDFANAIVYKHCDSHLTPRLEGAVSSRPDFHLLEFQSLPADRRCLLLLCNDELAHRRYRCELGRMLEISTALRANPNLRDLPVVYIRFNPHWFEVDCVLHDPPLAARFERLQRLLVDLQGGRVPEIPVNFTPAAENTELAGFPQSGPADRGTTS
eukprot:g67420.t1